MAELAEGISDLLSASDALGLQFVGLHLCEALEILQRELRALDSVGGLDV